MAQEQTAPNRAPDPKAVFREQFNTTALLAAPITEKDLIWIFAIGMQAGMRHGARILDNEWFKTQQDCAGAIRDAAQRI